MSERYLIVSSDCHAGLPCEEYRPYLDGKHLAAFDEFLAERHANREESLKFNHECGISTSVAVTPRRSWRT